jgi:hypothetical protein
VHARAERDAFERLREEIVWIVEAAPRVLACLAAERVVAGAHGCLHSISQRRV